MIPGINSTKSNSLYDLDEKSRGLYCVLYCKMVSQANPPWSKRLSARSCFGNPGSNVALDTKFGISARLKHLHNVGVASQLQLISFKVSLYVVGKYFNHVCEIAYSKVTSYM